MNCLGPGSEVVFSCVGLTRISDARKGNGAGLLCLHGRLLYFLSVELLLQAVFGNLISDNSSY